MTPPLDPGDRVPVSFGVRTAELTTAAAGHDLWLASVGHGRRATLSSEEQALLASCRGFAPVEEHARRIAARRGLDDVGQAAVARVLSSLGERGFFTCSRELLRRLRARAGEEAPRTIGTVGIVTRDRPQALARCLHSFGGHLRAHGRTVRFVAVDGTETPAGSTACAEVLRAFSTELGFEAIHVVAAHKRGYAERLADHAGVDPALVRFALLDDLDTGTDTGSNRNALLLGSAGAPFLSADDDTVCELRTWPTARGGLALSSHSDPTSVTPFPSREAALAAVRNESACLLQLHERLLGRSLKACLDELPDEEVDLDALGPSMSRVLAEEGGRVVASFTGLVGDCGARYASFYLWSSGAQRLFEDDLHYASVLASRQVVRLVQSPTLSAGGLSMSTGFALDAEQLLPPFFPVMRGADLLFGQMVASCDETALFGHLPVAIGHHPLEDRRARREDLWERAPEINTYGLLACCLAAVRPSLRYAPRGERRLRLLGRLLTELGALANADFEALLAEQTVRLLGRQMSSLDAVLAGSPDRLWTRDLARYRDACVERLTAASLAPADLCGGDLRAMALFRQCLDRYGRLLQIWPELCAAAAALRASGNGLW
jgi:hypothetical protein